MRFLKKQQAQFSFFCLAVLGITVLVIYQNLENRSDNKGTEYDTDRNNLNKVKHTVADENNLLDKGQDIVARKGSRDNHVLLNSYMRSGSSFMGRMLGHRDDVFYYYEPLWTGNTWTYHKGIDELCSITTSQCLFKPEAIHVSRRILKNIYTCHLLDIGSRFQENIHANLYSGGENSWQPYHTCKKEGRRDKTYCLKMMEEFCRNHTTRVSKVLRLGLSLADLLMEDNPQLKIVHLFRDPRGTISSHVFTKWFPTRITNTKSIDMDAKVLCQRMKADIQAAISFHERYPDRLRGIQYEDFYDLEEKAKLLYDYLGMDASEKYLNFVSVKFSKNAKYNSTEIHPTKLFSYRRTLPWEVVQIVEKQCAEVILLLGLKLFGNEENYKDQNYSPIDGQLKFGLSKV